jgi:hypothetical protein
VASATHAFGLELSALLVGSDQARIAGDNRLPGSMPTEFGADASPCFHAL